MKNLTLALLFSLVLGCDTPVDADLEEGAEVLRQVRRCLQVHIRRQEHASECDRVEVLLGRTRRCAVHRGARFRQEVLDDHLLDVTVTAMRCSDLDEGVDAVHQAGQRLRTRRLVR